VIFVGSGGDEGLDAVIAWMRRDVLMLDLAQ
jgi:hypothetical protein